MATPEGIANVAMSAFVHVLAGAKVLTEPKPAAPAMTVDDGARLLCELSRSVRLSEPDLDKDQLIDSIAMVDYAWTQARTVGIPQAQMSDAQEAYRLLLAHHRAHP
jgi:hypothetical protein